MSYCYSNDELIHGILEEREEVLQYLYGECYPKVRWLVVKNNGTEEDAKDIFHDAFIVLYQKLKEESLVLTCSVSTYIYSICRIIWLKELARKGKLAADPGQDAEYVFIEDPCDPESEKDSKEWDKLYYSLFKELSRECKKILNLHFRRYSVNEITRLLGYPNDQYTMDRKYRCKQNLIKRITSHPKYKRFNEGR